MSVLHVHHVSVLHVHHVSVLHVHHVSVCNVPGKTLTSLFLSMFSSISASVWLGLFSNTFICCSFCKKPIFIVYNRGKRFTKIQSMQSSSTRFISMILQSFNTGQVRCQPINQSITHRSIDHCFILCLFTANLLKKIILRLAPSPHPTPKG